KPREGGAGLRLRAGPQKNRAGQAYRGQSLSIMCIHSSFPDGFLFYIPVVNRIGIYYNGYCIPIRKSMLIIERQVTITMADNRIYNFSAGPSMLPVPVLERCASEMLNYKGSGMSVMEMSHRSKVYDGIIKETEAALRRVLSIPENYKVLFLQGGATTQFEIGRASCR